MSLKYSVCRRWSLAFHRSIAKLEIRDCDTLNADFVAQRSAALWIRCIPEGGRFAPSVNRYVILIAQCDMEI
jgi:hypothetical protein